MSRAFPFCPPPPPTAVKADKGAAGAEGLLPKQNPGNPQLTKSQLNGDYSKGLFISHYDYETPFTFSIPDYLFVVFWPWWLNDSSLMDLDDGNVCHLNNAPLFENV